MSFICVNEINKNTKHVNVTTIYRYPFRGLGCEHCKITSCMNGGVFNATACRCDCPPGFGGLDCGSKLCSH